MKIPFLDLLEARDREVELEHVLAHFASRIDEFVEVGEKALETLHFLEVDLNAKGLKNVDHLGVKEGFVVVDGDVSEALLRDDGKDVDVGHALRVVALLSRVEVLAQELSDGSNLELFDSFLDGLDNFLALESELQI